MSADQILIASEEWKLLCRMRLSSPDVALRLAPPAGSLSTPQHEQVLAATLRAAEIARMDGAKVIGPDRVRRVLADLAPELANDPGGVDRFLVSNDTADEWGIRRRVLERRNASAILRAVTDLAARGHAGQPYSDLVDAFQALQRHVLDPTEPGRRPWVYSARSLAEETLAHLEAARDRPSVSAGLLGPSIAALPPGSLCVIGGDTNTGKSSLMLYLALAFDRAGRKVGIISLEDPAHVWGDRLQATQSGVSLLSMARHGGRLDMDQWDDVRRSIEDLGKRNVRLAIMPTSHIDRVSDEMRAMCTEGCEVIFVDYVQEISDPDRDDDRRLLVTQSARRLKAVAREHGVPLFLGSQLARASGRVRGNEPTSQSLKESGDLENMAEQIVLLWRESDDTDAPTLGKISKDKCSGERPRFRLERERSGAISDVRAYDPPQNGGAKW